MKDPTIAIVGRPNVGKSSLFNRLIGQRKAIVDPMEGVTRDRVVCKTSLYDQNVILVDTGGIPTAKTEKNFGKEIFEQTQKGIEEAEILLFVVDGKVGLMKEDEIVAKMLLLSKKPVIMAVNKIDGTEDWADFYQLGFEKIFPVSSVQGSGIELLKETLSSMLKKPVIPKEPLVKTMRVAIIGQTNVGKSSLFNALLKEPRAIVSEKPGTTVDSIDVSIQYENWEYQFIDTAGIRRKSKEKSSVEKFAAIRTEEAMEKAEICLFVLDVQNGIGSQEKKILEKIEEFQKGCILIFNKWDLIHGYRQERILESLTQEMPFLSHFPILFTSAKTEKNLEKIFPLLIETYNEYQKRVSTSKLNDFLREAVENYQPPMLQGKRLKLYYMTQVSVAPPKFVLFVNYSHLFVESYKRYLIQRFRKNFGFLGIPIALTIRKRSES